jgi:ribonucleotide reductase alpha subunit
LAKEHGYYDTFYGSPLSMGQFQFDLWKVTPSDRYDWNELREQIIKTGVRNSLLIALMPTASTSQILGNNECFEPFTSNLYARRTLAGDFTIVNQHLVKELIQLNLWNEQLKDEIIQNKGSIQSLKLPDHIKQKYKIVWEIPMKHLINMSRDRAPYICQSQSLNLWIESPTIPILTSMHFYAWEQGLKTGIYYLRRKPKHQVQQFTIAPETCETCSA